MIEWLFTPYVFYVPWVVLGVVVAATVLVLVALDARRV